MYRGFCQAFVILILHHNGVVSSGEVLYLRSVWISATYSKGKVRDKGAAIYTYLILLVVAYL